MDERYRKVGPFTIDRRNVRKLKSYFFLSVFMVMWTFVSLAYAASDPKTGDMSLVLWLAGLLVSALKIIVIDAINEVKRGLRKVIEEKQDKAACGMLHQTLIEKGRKNHG